MVSFSIAARWALSLAVGSGSFQLEEQVRVRDRVLSRHEIEGRFLGFCEGDYVHAFFQPKTGRPVGFFMAIKSPDMDLYLAMHPDESVLVEYERVETSIPEAGGREVIDRISAVSAGKTSYARWSNNEGRKLPAEERARLEKLARSLTKDCRSFTVI